MRTLLFVVAALAACEGSKTKPAEPTKGSATVVHATRAAGTVVIYVDDKPVGKLAAEQVGMWPRLDTLVPMSARRLGTWQTLSIKRESGEPTVLQQPSTKHPDLIPALFPGEGGMPAFGMFDPVELAKKGKPALREDHVGELRIAVSNAAGRGENDHQGGEAVDPTKLELTIKSAAGEAKVTGDKLLQAPRTPPPGETEAKGWPLSVILESAGIKKYEKLAVADAKGNSLTLEKQDLDPNKSIPYVKLNRQGTLRFIVYKKEGDSWKRGGDLRGLAYIEVLQ